MKYVPEYPAKGFTSIEEAREWVEKFTDWYNNMHLHSNIKYVTPSERHQGGIYQDSCPTVCPPVTILKNQAKQR